MGYEDATQGRCFTYFSFYGWSLDGGALEGQLANLSHSQVIEPSHKDWSHPLEFGNLSADAVQVLRDSQYLFARKFRADAVLEKYEEIVCKSPQKTGRESAPGTSSSSAGE